MELREAIYNRRSIRRYLDKPIEDAVLKEIIDAGLWAPSGVNLQPWFYVVVRSSEKLKVLKTLMTEAATKNQAHLEKRFAKDLDVAANALAFIKTLGNAPVVLLVFRNRPDYSALLQDEGIIQSIGASVQNILLTTYEKGIASCWMTAPGQAGMNEEIRDIFAPGHGSLVCAVTLGYPLADTNITAPARKKDRMILI